ncbi:hypothetical protein LVJ94_34545 [Pendulispora rubella]|uniref:Phage tail protein n=1 Tax=Pendulispora rubella TaxID=2741070 RepID=A0ABZ2KTM9_9BACT
MAIDLQVVFPQEVVDLSSVRPVAGIIPRSIEVVGKDFRAVDEVRINGVASPDVVVLSPNRLIAQVPELLRYDTLTSVTVLSAALTTTDRSLLRFRLGTTASKTTGILRLVQIFVKLLCTTPGRDIFAPALGGGVLKRLGLTFGRDEGGAIISDFIIAVSNVQRQILAIQAGNRSLSRDERLLSARVVSAAFNKAEGALVVSIELLSQAGRAALANLTV